jgi:hypothetical protein
MSPELQLIRIMFGYAMARARTVKSRTNNQFGASAIEWAVIAGIVVTLAIGISVVVKSVVERRKVEINQG